MPIDNSNLTAVVIGLLNITLSVHSLLKCCNYYAFLNKVLWSHYNMSKGTIIG